MGPKKQVFVAKFDLGLGFTIFTFGFMAWFIKNLHFFVYISIHTFIEVESQLWRCTLCTHPWDFEHAFVNLLNLLTKTASISQHDSTQQKSDLNWSIPHIFLSIISSHTLIKHVPPDLLQGKKFYPSLHHECFLLKSVLGIWRQHIVVTCGHTPIYWR